MAQDVDLEGAQYAVDGVGRYVLAYKIVESGVAEGDGEGFHFLGVDVHDVAAYLTSGYFFNHEGRKL